MQKNLRQTKSQNFNEINNITDFSFCLSLHYGSAEHLLILFLYVPQQISRLHHFGPDFYLFSNNSKCVIS